MSEEAKTRAREMLLGGEQDLASIQEATSLSAAVVRGLKGQLVKTGQLPSKASKRAKKSPKPDDEDSLEDLSEPLPGEADILAQILKDSGVKKKAAVLKLVDHSGYDVESIYRALGSVGAGRSIKRTVITLWASQQNEDIPGYIEDELETSAPRDRERGRGRMMSREEWESKNEIRNLSEQFKEFKNMIIQGGGPPGRQQGGFRQARIPIDASGRPCHPDQAVSVRYEQLPSSEGGEIQVLRKEIESLKERLFSDQIAGLANQIQELKENRGSDTAQIVGAIKETFTSFTSSEGGPVVRAFNPLLNASVQNVLAHYQNMSVDPIPPNLENPEPTPPALVERLREHGFVSKLVRRRGGG